ncbi:MAG: L-carnitine dehydratase/bile acid-inducible protein F, partial [uncultured Rubrobacteraceae bacterium]
AAAGGRAGAGPIAGPGRSLRDDDPRGPRGRYPEGRAPGPRRRHAPLGAALRGRGRSPRIGLLPLHQPQQALGRRRPQDAGGAGEGKGARGWGGRRHREHAKGRPGETRPRLRGPQGDQPEYRVLLHNRLRTGAGRDPARLRLSRAGPWRDHGHHRFPGRRPGEGRGRDSGHGLRPARLHRHPRRPPQAFGDGRGRPHRGPALRDAARLARQPRPGVSGLRRGQGPHGQRPPLHRPLPDLRRIGQTRGRRRRQRRAVREPLPRPRARRACYRRTLRHEPGPRREPRGPGGTVAGRILEGDRRRVGREGTGGGRPLRPGQYARGRLLRRARAGLRHVAGRRAPDGRGFEDASLAHPRGRGAAADPPPAPDARPAHRRGRRMDARKV